MSILELVSTSAGSTDQANVATLPINTTGANFIALVISVFETGFNGFTLADTYNNTPSKLVGQVNSNSGNIIYYYDVPTVGTGHIWTLSSTVGNIFPTLSVVAFSGVNASPFESQSGFETDGTVASIQPGSLTPGESNALLITGLTGFVSTGIAINSGFSKASTDYAGTNLAGGVGWLIQTAALPENPAWTSTITGSFVGACATMAVFKPASTPSVGQPGSLMMMGCGN